MPVEDKENEDDEDHNQRKACLSKKGISMFLHGFRKTKRSIKVEPAIQQHEILILNNNSLNCDENRVGNCNLAKISEQSSQRQQQQSQVADRVATGNFYVNQKSSAIETTHTASQQEQQEMANSSHSEQQTHESEQYQQEQQPQTQQCAPSQTSQLLINPNLSNVKKQIRQQQQQLEQQLVNVDVSQNDGNTSNTSKIPLRRSRRQQIPNHNRFSHQFSLCCKIERKSLTPPVTVRYNSLLDAVVTTTSVATTATASGFITTIAGDTTMPPIDNIENIANNGGSLLSLNSSILNTNYATSSSSPSSNCLAATATATVTATNNNCNRVMSSSMVLNNQQHNRNNTHNHGNSNNSAGHYNHLNVIEHCVSAPQSPVCNKSTNSYDNLKYADRINSSDQRCSALRITKTSSSCSVPTTYIETIHQQYSSNQRQLQQQHPNIYHYYQQQQQQHQHQYQQQSLNNNSQQSKSNHNHPSNSPIRPLLVSDCRSRLRLKLYPPTGKKGLNHDNDSNNDTKSNGTTTQQDLNSRNMDTIDKSKSSNINGKDSNDNMNTMPTGIIDRECSMNNPNTTNAINNTISVHSFANPVNNVERLSYLSLDEEERPTTKSSTSAANKSTAIAKAKRKQLSIPNNYNHFNNYNANQEQFDHAHFAERQASGSGLARHALMAAQVLNLIPTDKARDRSLLDGHLGSSSLLGPSELLRVLPNKEVTIFVGTWNMNGQNPPKQMNDFVLPSNVENVPDIIAVGTQESTPDRFEWEVLLQETLGPSHVLFHSTTLGTLHLAVYMRRDLIWYCSQPEDASMSVRTGSAFRTKGAVAISFCLFGTSMLFVTSHLTAHQQKVKERVTDVKRIINALDLPKNLHLRTKNKDVTQNFDNVFWCGDLNFRLSEPREKLLEWVQNTQFPLPSHLPHGYMHTDQLSTVLADGAAFRGFMEANITFPPTYKYDPGTQHFDTSSKQRAPAYTDRILYKYRQSQGIMSRHHNNHVAIGLNPLNSNQQQQQQQLNQPYIECLLYDSVPSITTSDHKPVLALFKVSIRAGSDSIPLAAGQFCRDIYLEGIKRRLNNQYSGSSAVCSIQ